MIEYLNEIDSSIFLFFNGMHAPFLDRFMVLFTGRYIWIPMYATISLLLLRGAGPRRATIYALAIGIAILLTDQLCASLIRPVAERLRPSNPENPLSAFTIIVNNYRGGPYGFPSCHSANSFALAGFLIMLFRSRRLSLFILGWALLNSYTRLYLGVHYPGDLLTGAIIGFGIGCSCQWVATRICRRLYPTLPAVSSFENRKNFRRPLVTIPYGPEIAGIGRATISITAADVLYLTGAITALFIIIASAI